MQPKSFELCVLVLIIKCFLSECFTLNGGLLVIPEDFATALAGIYGFIPRLVKGNDHRFGYGFRFGNHADFQVLYELGPQTATKQLQPIRARSASASYRQRIVRRRPFIELLLRSGILQLKEEAVNFDVEFDTGNGGYGYGYDEPR